MTAAIAAIIVLPCTLFLIRFKPEDKGLLPYGAEAFTAEGVQSSGAPSSASEGVSAKRAYHSLAFWLLFFAFVAFSMLGGFSQLLPLYMSNVGLTAIVGLIATMVMIGQFSGTLGLGAVSDRFGGLVAGMLGSGIVLGGFLLLIFFGNLAPSALGGGLFYGVALSLSSVTPALLCRDAFGNKDFASLYSTLMFAVSAVGAFGMTIITLILDTTGSFYPALWFGVALCVAAAAAVITSLKLAKRLPREA